EDEVAIALDLPEHRREAFRHRRGAVEWTTDENEQWIRQRIATHCPRYNNLQIDRTAAFRVAILEDLEFAAVAATRSLARLAEMKALGPPAGTDDRTARACAERERCCDDGAGEFQRPSRHRRLLHR